MLRALGSASHAHALPFVPCSLPLHDSQLIAKVVQHTMDVLNFLWASRFCTRRLSAGLLMAAQSSVDSTSGVFSASVAAEEPDCSCDISLLSLRHLRGGDRSAGSIVSGMDISSCCINWQQPNVNGGDFVDICISKDAHGIYSRAACLRGIIVRYEPRSGPV